MLTLMFHLHCSDYGSILGDAWENELEMHSMHLCRESHCQGLCGVRGFSFLSSCFTSLNFYLVPLVGAAGWEYPWQASTQATLIVPQRTAH